MGALCRPFGLGTEDEREFEACGADKRQRGRQTDEAVEVMRLLWSQDSVTFRGRYFNLTDVTIQPKPVQKELPPIWIGGRSQPAIKRTARIGDGWLVSQATPEEVGAGVSQIKAMAPEFGNDIEDDHYGALFSFCIADSYEEARATAEPYMLRRRTDVGLRRLLRVRERGADSRSDRLLHRRLEQPSSSPVPACPPAMMMDQLQALGDDILPIYH